MLMVEIKGWPSSGAAQVPPIRVNTASSRKCMLAHTLAKPTALVNSMDIVTTVGFSTSGILCVNTGTCSTTIW